MKKFTRKAFAFELKDATDSGEFTGIASVYGNKDLGGDIVERGAFTKTLQERGAEVPILWQHDQSTPIGLGTLTDTPTGLQIKGKLSLGTTKGREAYELMKDGVLKGLSIGYDVVKKKFADGARHLTELKLYEVSTVTFPMNEEAEIVAVKALDDIDVKAIGLPAPLEAALTAMLTKAASLSDRLSGACAAVRAKYPLGNAYPIYDEIYDDYLIVSTGCDGEYFSVLITGWSDDGVPTLGDAVEVERTYTPVTADEEAVEGETAASDAGTEAKAGRRVSTATATKLKAAHDYMKKAAAHVKDVLRSNTATDDDTKQKGTAAPAAATATPEPSIDEIASLLSDHTTAMRDVLSKPLA